MRFSAGIAVLLFASSLIPAQAPSKHTPTAARNVGPDSKPGDAKSDPKPQSKIPTERLTYDVEWRLIHAGTVVIQTQPSHAELKLDSAGIVSSLFKVHDAYSADYEEGFCATGTLMDSMEGKRHHETRAAFDRVHNQASYLERDILKDTVLHSSQIEVPNCVHEVVGAFLKLRGMPMDPGQSEQIPMSDGRRSSPVKIEAQDREEVKTTLGSYKTVRYEAYMLNGVIYTRKGRAQVWLTDDARHLPVQIRLRMNFPVGTVTLQLQKEEHL